MGTPLSNSSPTKENERKNSRSTMMKEQQQNNNNNNADQSWKQKKGYTATIFLLAVVGCTCLFAVVSHSRSSTSQGYMRNSPVSLEFLESLSGKKNFCDLAEKKCASEVAACDADPHCRPQLTDCQQCTCFPTQHCLTGPDNVHGRPKGCVGKTAAGKALAKCLGDADDA